MDTWKKTNEAWFGDTFDRASICAYNSATTDAVNGVSVTKGVDNNAVFTCTNTNNWDNATLLVGNNGEIAYKDYAVKSDVDSICSQLKKLQEQIDELKVRSMVTSNLRSALKTLQYKREVK